MPPLIPTWPQPSHPSLLKVETNPQAYQSSATSLVSLAAGSLFSPITNTTPIPRRTYASVQTTAEGQAVDFNSDLVYCNHSCAPTLEFDMQRFEVRVARDRDLKVSDTLTWSLSEHGVGDGAAVCVYVWGTAMLRVDSRGGCYAPGKVEGVLVE